MDKNKDQYLEIQHVDIAVSALKSSLGVLPIVGPLMGELVGYTIPNQRFDRLVKYSIELEKRLGNIDKAILRLALQNENFTDLMEESLRQAARSLSDERREYIASIIANSLTPENIEFQEAKHVLRILGELNDIEIIWLRYYLRTSDESDHKFRQKHEQILNPPRQFGGITQNESDKFAFQESYKEHLVQLGLLGQDREPVSVDTNGEVSGAGRVRGYYLTHFGRIVLEQINLQ